MPYLEKPVNFIYRWQFVWSLRARIRRKARLFPGLYDAGRLRGIRTVREFDSRYTAPLLPDIRIPTLIIHAADDPMLPAEPLDGPRCWPIRTSSSWCRSRADTSDSWPARATGDRDDRWAEHRLLQFFRTLEGK